MTPSDLPGAQATPRAALEALREEIALQERRRRLYSFGLLLLCAATLTGGFVQAEAMNSGGFLSGLSQFFDYPGEIIAETVAGGWRNFAGHLWRFTPALLETLNIALTATLLGAAGGLGLALLSTRSLSPAPPLIPLIRRVMDVLRGFPELIIALLLVFIFGGNALPAIIAIALHSAGALGKLFSEVLDNVDSRPVEGLEAVGAGWAQRIRYGALPQIAPNLLSYALLRLEINVRASAILGYVGAGGVGIELRRTLGWGPGLHDETLAIFTLLILTIALIDQLSSAVRRRLSDPGPHQGAPRGLRGREAGA
ncbi:MAG: phosphonate ABC transporter, permease protein PhnE [Pseudomonadota bacterium]